MSIMIWCIALLIIMISNVVTNVILMFSRIPKLNDNHSRHRRHSEMKGQRTLLSVTYEVVYRFHWFRKSLDTHLINNLVVLAVILMADKISTEETERQVQLTGFLTIRPLIMRATIVTKPWNEVVSHGRNNDNWWPITLVNVSIGTWRA